MELIDAFSDVVEVLDAAGRGEVALVAADELECGADSECVVDEDGTGAICEVHVKVSGTAFPSLAAPESPLSPFPAVIILIFFR